jgi:hypothetical protein
MAPEALRRLRLAQKLRQLRDIHRNPRRVITREQASSQMSAIPLKADYREIKSKIPKTI